MVRERQLNHAVLASGLANVECPLVGPDGWLLNVCSVTREGSGWPTRGGDITATHVDHPGETHVVMNTSTDDVTGIPAALAFGPDGSLYVCDEGRRSIVRVTPEGDVSDWIAQHGGEPLNGPNDLSFAEDGSLYFTDPWGSSPRSPVAAVYGVSPNGETSRIDGGMQFTNGIVVDGDKLLVAETYPRSVWEYRITRPGHADGRRLFCRLPTVDNPPKLPAAVREILGVDHVVGPDGMCLDSEGHLYVANYGAGAVYVFDRTGRLLERIPAPGDLPTNLCFGGDRLEVLYVTVDDPGLLVSYKPGVLGRDIPFSPRLIENHPFAGMCLPLGRAASLPGHRKLAQ